MCAQCKLALEEVAGCWSDTAGIHKYEHGPHGAA